MRYSSVFFSLAAPLLASAAPARFYGLGKRAAADILVFQFADVLEQLESSFYQQALTTFTTADFVTAGFTSSEVIIEQFTTIQIDESTHSSTLQSAIQAIGGQPITTCQFDFSTVLTDVVTMAATARVVENVGIAAYIGGAALLTDPVLLTAAASILTVEARHQTILNLFSPSGTVIPASFDLAFTPSEVLAIASAFISGCDIGIPSNVPLSLTNTGTVAPGTALTFQATSINGTVPESQLFCQMLVGGAEASISLPFSQCVVPQGINGPVAIFITSDDQPLLGNVVDRATVDVVAGPTLAFIDTQPQTINQLLVTPPQGGAATATATLTVSPSQASADISGASVIAPPSATATGNVGGATLGASGASAVSASATDGAPGASATSAPAASASGAASASTSTTASDLGTGGPNMATGPSANNAINVLGWS